MGRSGRQAARGVEKAAGDRPAACPRIEAEVRSGALIADDRGPVCCSNCFRGPTPGLTGAGMADVNPRPYGERVARRAGEGVVPAGSLPVKKARYARRPLTLPTSWVPPSPRWGEGFAAIPRPPLINPPILYAWMGPSDLIDGLRIDMQRSSGAELRNRIRSAGV